MNGKEMKVLIVEDNPGDAFMIEDMLHDLKLGMKINVAKDGQEALDILMDGQYNAADLVILDLNLPKVDGFEVLKYMKARPKLNSIPVVVMTGSLRKEDEKRSRELGATDYCLKPSTSEEMDITKQCLRKNLELVPTKGKTYGPDTSASLGLAPFPLLFRERVNLNQVIERAMNDFQNKDPWDRWK